MSRAMALCLLAALVASVSAERNLQRYLQQSFSCNGISELEGRCQNLCCCVIQQDSSLARFKGACPGLCNSCINSCKNTKSLGKTCEDGLKLASGTNAAISKCLNIYNSASDKAKAINQFASC